MFVKIFMAMQRGCKIHVDTEIDTELFKLFGIFKSKTAVQELKIIFKKMNLQ